MDDAADKNSSLSMNRKKKLEWFLGILGVIILGALGSGLWNVVFAPLGSALTRGFLSLVTLGVEAAKDSVYDKAAIGFSEKTSQEVVAVFVEMIMSIPVVIAVAEWRIRCYKKPTLADVTLAGNAASSSRRRRRIENALIVLMFLVASVFFVQCLLTFYTNSVTGNFHRTLAVVAPHISSEQRVYYAARFARVHTRKEFVALFAELNALAEQNGEKRSDFSPW
jgi:hypothetical protein